MTSSIPRSEALTEIPTAIAQPGVTGRVSRKAQQWLYILALVVSDVGMTALAFGVAHWIRFDLQLPIFRLNASPSRLFYVRVLLISLPLWLVIHLLSGLYDQNKLLGGTEEYSSAFRSVSIGFVLVTVGEFLAELVIARGWMMLAWALTFFFMSAGRFTLRRTVYFLRRHGFFLAPALIIGANPEGSSLAQQLIEWESSGLQVHGFVDDLLPQGSPVTGNLRVLGSLDDLEEILNSYQIEELVLASSALSREQMLKIFREFGFVDKVNLRMSSGLFEIITTGLNVKEFAYAPLVGVNKVRLTGVNRVLKASLDYAVTIPCLILISPVLLLIALLVRLDSPGPIFHRRRVLGVNGREFDALKFRTMHDDGDEILEKHPELQKELTRNHKLRDDPRVTAIGKTLRRFSLDELPQLFNVLTRDMSLVGPRMISPGEMEKYSQWGLNLLTVRPGITGIWQVSGRSDVSYDERVRLDMHYVRNWTIWMDLQILVQTIPAVLRGRGAY
jgi:exopolysaccharide biosynthesis polyprenyl glycosylphosphotransferase